MVSGIAAGFDPDIEVVCIDLDIVGYIEVYTFVDFSEHSKAHCIQQDNSRQQ